MTVQLLRHDWTQLRARPSRLRPLPTIAYVALLVAAAMIWSEHDIALDVLAGSLLLLLIVNIRNAWDLTLSMVRHQTGAALMALTAGRARS